MMSRGRAAKPPPRQPPGGASRLGVDWEWCGAQQAAGGFKQVGDALDVVGSRAVVEQLDEGVGFADAGESPVADAALGDEALERGRDGVGDDGCGGEALVALAVQGDSVVHEHDVDVVEPHAFEAAVEAGREVVVDLGGQGVADAALGRDAHAVGQGVAECLADDLFSLAVAVGGREVEQVNAGVYGFADGGDALLTVGLAPYAGDAASAEGECARRTEFAEWTLSHGGSISHGWRGCTGWGWFDRLPTRY